MKTTLRYLIFILISSLFPSQILANDSLDLEGASLHTFEVYQTSREFMISPNPASSTINVYLPKGFENAKLSVFDVLGKEIYHVELNTLHPIISISKWNNGVYLVRITTETESQTKRFVKQ
ncbi:T9SS type A sorting domain-containing protein [Flavobacteriaceae bacterium LMO-SS05]